LEFLVDWLRSIQLGLTVIPLCLAPLFFGSVDRLSVAVWVALLSAAMLCGVTLPINTAQRRILLGFFAVCGAYAAVAIIQVIPGLIDGSGDPIWQRLNQLLPLHVPSRISARAEIPAEALGHFLLAVTSFASGVFVGTSQRNSEILTAAARYSILLYAMYGILAMVFTPNMLLWAPKLAYQGSLTATFVNHNTAATFIGSGLILWFCLALQTVQSLQLGSLRMLLLTSSNEHVAFKLILRLAAALTCLFALLLTGSRGGLICTSLGLFVAIGLMVTNAIRPKFWYVFASATAALTAMLIWLSQVGRVGSHGFFDQARWSVYEYCVESIRQRPLLGTGAGTFADFFPSLRGLEFNSWGVWDFAHSTILEIAVEMGIPIALAIVFGAGASLLILANGALRPSLKDRSRSSLAAVTGIAVASYLHSTVDFSLQIPGYLIVFGSLIGCWLARSVADQVPARSSSLGTVRSKAGVPELVLEIPPAASRREAS
jgi:O-antigen ligase